MNVLFRGLEARMTHYFFQHGSSPIISYIHGRKGYTVLVTYSYELDGKTYQSDIYPGGRSTNQAGKIREAASYRIGSTRLLSVNPSNPDEISHVLGYDLGTFWWVLLVCGMGLVFLAIGIMIMKPPKVSMDTIVKFTPKAFIIIGIGFVAGASLAFINNPESLTGPIFFWIFGLFFIVIPILNLRNQARRAVKTEVNLSLGKSGRYSVTEANGVVTVLYGPGEKHTNTDEQFLWEVARYAATVMDEVRRKENISKISVWAEGLVALQDGSGHRRWEGVRLVLDKENWEGPMIGELSNLAALDQWQYLRLCSFKYISEDEFPEWPK